ncbi:MAG: hypothetical protein WCO84_05110 [bacterium]
MNKIYWVILFIILIFGISGMLSLFSSSTKNTNNPAFLEGEQSLEKLSERSGCDLTSSTSTLDEFAGCLASKNVVMYGAVWCSHCQNQKKLFGDSFRLVKYVECPDNIKLCTDKGVTGYPTWEFSEDSK